MQKKWLNEEPGKKNDRKNEAVPHIFICCFTSIPNAVHPENVYRIENKEDNKGDNKSGF